MSELNDLGTILTGARDLLANQGWCKGMLARDKNGHYIDETSPNAYSFCLVGSLWASKHKNKLKLDVLSDALNLISDKIGVISISDWNDRPSHTKEKVINILDQILKENS